MEKLSENDKQLCRNSLFFSQNAPNLSYCTCEMTKEHMLCLKVSSLVYLKVQMAQKTGFTIKISFYNTRGRHTIY